MTDDTDDASDLAEFKFRGTDRPRGILTEKDRRILRGNASYENKQQIRDARYRMRKRVKESFLDLEDLNLYYPIEEYELIMESIQDEFASYQAQNVAEAAIRAAVILAKIGVENGYIAGNGGKPMTFTDFLEEQLDESITAVERAFTEQESIPKVNTEIEVAHESFDEDHLLAKLVYGEPMKVTKEDVLTYLRYGDLDRLEQKLREENTVVYYRDEIREVPIEPGSAVFNPEESSAFDPIIGDRQQQQTDEDNSE